MINPTNKNDNKVYFKHKRILDRSKTKKEKKKTTKIEREERKAIGVGS